MKSQWLGQLKIAQEEKNYWVAFEILKNALGSTSYKAALREVLGAADKASVPKAYEVLWNLRIGGILNLNLDRLATRAYTSLNKDKQIVEFSGKDCGNFIHMFKSTLPFIANLHGHSADASTWVLTSPELRGLSASQGYRTFINTCISSRTILFLGISAQDTAVGGHLERLAKQNIDTGQHFWVTHRSDEAQEKWAESVGIRIIYYNGDNNHEELHKILNDLLKFVPQEESQAPPVQSPIGADLVVCAPVLSPEELAPRSAEEQRQILNIYARKILEHGTADEYEKYEQFCKEYESPIYRSWHVSVRPPHNVLLGYVIKSEIGRGAYGRVFQADAPDGTNVAIKILHQEIREDTERLQSFRRGIRAMRYLSERGIKGMIPYRQAAEIPACTIMDYIPGPNLKEAVESRQIGDWETVLKISVELARILKSAHGIPERVLHRDIRPSNIMLQGFYDNSGAWNVVLLDFDLSWHNHAIEVSVMNVNAATGYLAPEQVMRNNIASTRSALVDSYGLGMTLYFLRRAIEPKFLEHRHETWKDTLKQLGEIKCDEWKSLPKRFARVIHNATLDKQSDRWDMSFILGELERLQEAFRRPKNVIAAELLAEEITMRGEFSHVFSWNQDRVSGIAQLPSGIEVHVKADESQREVKVSLYWRNTGRNASHKNIKKWHNVACDKAFASLKDAGWHVKIRANNINNIEIDAIISTTDASVELDKIARSVHKAVKDLELS